MPASQSTPVIQDPNLSSAALSFASDEVADNAPLASARMPSSVEADKIACIVCLADLPETSDDIASGGTFDQIARLVPCNHAMHNSCLAPWVERANSCPICRQSFNKVKLSNTLTGMPIGEYDVEDRIQRPDTDQNFVGMELFDEMEEPTLPCLLCNEPDHEEVMLLCDGCDGPFHTYCCGLNDIPQGVWYCPLCLSLENEPTSSEAASGHRGRSRAGGSNQRSSRHSENRRARPRRRRQRNDSAASRIRRPDDAHGGWTRVWQEVWSHLNSDLDRVEDEQVAEEAHLREWTRRAEIAQAQGDGYSGFRAAAPSIVGFQWSRPRERIPVDTPTSPEAIAAWSAFDELKRLEGKVEQSNSRKRTNSKTATASPKSSQEAPQVERKLKRPRTKPSSNFTNLLRRDSAPAGYSGPSTPTTSATNSEQRTSVFGSWISKLDCAVAEKHDHSNPSLQHTTPRVASNSPTQESPRLHVSMPTFPPSSPPWSRPHSPLTATSPANYMLSPSVSPRDPVPPAAGPSSPVQFSSSHRPLSPELSPSTSPTRPFHLSVKSKEEIQAVVRAALRPHYHARKVNTEQYTEINQNVSRHLYEVVRSPSNGFSTTFNEVDEQMERLRKMAEQEVLGALTKLTGTC
ncbi:hypothetical protein BDZ91DRAFT_848752 [Kalaharituber pfeilii]|nr:hypothetical protein BDZ91DRAFT_848752 [Kalaharituber pfeilii]